jgi:hypothetical protein
MTNNTNTSGEEAAAVSAAFAEQDAEGRKQFEQQWEKITPLELAYDKELERQRLLQGIADEQAKTVTTRGTETRHMRTVIRASGKPVGEN